MTPKQEAALRLALEFIKQVDYPPYDDKPVIAAIDEALAEQPAQEPVAWIYQNSNTEQEYLVWKKGTGGRNWRPLFTHQHGATHD